MSLAIREKSTFSQQEVAQFHREGFFVARQLFSKEEIDEIRNQFMDASSDGPIPGMSDVPKSFSPDDPLSKYPRVMQPHWHPDVEIGKLSRKYIVDQRIHDYLQPIMGEEPVAVQSMFYFKPPGARGQDLHQDNFYLRVSPGTCYAAWLAVDDCDEDNGTLVVVPETNTMDIVCPQVADASQFFTTEHVEVPEGHTPLAVIMKAGDVLFFNGSLIHGSYPNTTEDRFRRSLIFHYVPASSQELSTGYKDPLLFDGTVIKIDAAVGGGPCGTVQGGSTFH
jgi:ectoine hydroxylase-related dioxygenase (phytanoyl-CoA dioxygenase family)